VFGLLDLLVGSRPTQDGLDFCHDILGNP